mmetsp:Transcript_7902/g.11775  ORF Transcript_7902/g.11775 Transcript_7902/m.11775 type:complete len:242 (-) Transcript_7902:333-1058(-)
MAGLGRRSHYRKHLTDSVLNDLPEPDFTKGERIAKVVGTRGSNQFEIVVSSATVSADDGKNDNKSDDSTTNKNSKHSTQLAILPTKFRKLIWVKRNDFVLVQCGQEDEGEEEEGEESGSIKNDNNKNNVGDISGGIRYIITHILYKDQVKHLLQKKIWPSHDPFFDTHGILMSENVNIEKVAIEDDDDYDEDEEDESNDNHDGITYYDDHNDDDYFVNTNRIAKLDIQDSDSDEESSDDEY